MKYGYYIVLNYDAFRELCRKVDPQVICDFIHLACYGNGINCIASERSTNSVGIKTIYKILGKDADMRLQSLTECGLIVTKGYNYQISSRYISCRGKSAKTYRECIKVHKDYFKSLCNNLDLSQRKLVGRIFNLFFCANVRFNLLCDDIYNININKIKNPYRRKEIIELAGFCKGHDSLYNKKLTDLQFTHRGFQFRVILHGIREPDFCGGYFINPLLFYRGKDIDAALDIKVKTKSGKRIGYAILDDEED